MLVLTSYKMAHPTAHALNPNMPYPKITGILTPQSPRKSPTVRSKIEILDGLYVWPGNILHNS